MALPPLATVEDLQVRTGQTYAGAELDRAVAVLADTSALARAEAGKAWMDTTVTPNVVNAPDVVETIVLAAAKRAMDNPDGLTSETVGDYTWRKDGSEAGVYLTDNECRILRRLAGKSGLWTQKTTRLDHDPATGFVYDQYGLEPFPYYALE